MLLSSDKFTQLKCGTAVSPITDFELYGKKKRIFPHISFMYVYNMLSKIILKLSFPQRLPSQSATWAPGRIPKYTR